MAKAVSEGHREFAAIAVVGGKKEDPEDYSYPCGSCRQFMREFCDPACFQVITARSRDDYVICTLDELLPHSFGPGNLV
jgi:cytidine deaminase